MKAELVDGALISVPYSVENERVTKPSYQWDCWNRGRRRFVILQWTHSGEGCFDDGRGPVPVPKDHAFVAVVPERATYSYPQDGREPWVFSWVNFYGALGCTLFEAFQREFGHVVHLSPQGAAAAAFRRMRALATKAGADRWQVSQLAYAFILEWWREASEPGRGSGEGIERAIRFCQDHFREPHGVKEIAAEAGMSREHFTRIFTERMKETPAAFLRNLRLREAETFLRDTRLPLDEIALRCGFYSARHLMRAFQRKYGKNPSEIRRRKMRKY